MELVLFFLTVEIIVDDGSFDGTATFALKLAAEQYPILESCSWSVIVGREVLCVMSFCMRVDGDCSWPMWAVLVASQTLSCY